MFTQKRVEGVLKCAFLYIDGKPQSVFIHNDAVSGIGREDQELSSMQAKRSILKIIGAGAAVNIKQFIVIVNVRLGMDERESDHGVDIFLTKEAVLFTDIMPGSIGDDQAGSLLAFVRLAAPVRGRSLSPLSDRSRLSLGRHCQSRG